MANEMTVPQGGVMTGVAAMPAFMRQILMLAALSGAVALGVAAVQWAQEPNYALLYGNLGDKDTSGVLDGLTKANIPYRLDPSSGAILVPAKQLHDARLKLASQGLPKGTGVGFELIDDKPSFGTSQLQETARYHRAIEGELARTISSMANVASARVHLAIPKQSAFIREQAKPRGSVLVNVHPGRVLEDGQVAAIVHLVASSVPNLSAEQVTVIDHKGKLLTGNDAARDLSTGASQFDYARKLESAYARRIEEILAPVVGAGSVKAQVAADLDFTVTEQTRESFNPQQVVRSEQVAEEVSTNGAVATGIPGALSNQPPGQATVPETTAAGRGSNQKPGAGGNAVAEAPAPVNTSKRATRNYELDKTISYTKAPTGAVKRVSVAVVVDDIVNVSKSGKVSRKPRAAEDLQRYTALVKEAIGFDEKRGDTVSVVNAAFNTPPASAPIPEPPLWKQQWVWDLAKQIGGGLAALLILLLVVRPLLKGITRPAALPAMGGATMLTLAQSGPGGAGAAAQLAGGSAESHMTTAKSIAQQDPKRVAQVVKNWVGNDG
jgi:flagellar M-ring protein FliF